MPSQVLEYVLIFLSLTVAILNLAGYLDQTTANILLSFLSMLVSFVYSYRRRKEMKKYLKRLSRL
jgi:hypothetical protein